MFHVHFDSYQVKIVRYKNISIKLVNKKGEQVVYDK